ncbi:MAG: hypothetical protein B7Z71_00540 [Acidocella sp. 21-58-7]|nr:MAG: hypothetical protein B7Z71_00540 [Acidocella sp. 21-58-7]
MLSAPQPPALIVVNSPAGASEVLDAYAEIFASIADALAIDLTVGFVVDNSSAVLPRIESSMKTGLLSIKTARRSLIYAGWLGPIENFPIAKSDTRRAALASGLVELQFPALVSPFLDLVRKTQAPFYELTNSPGLKLVDRSFISRWLNQCEPVSDFLVGVEND